MLGLRRCDRLRLGHDSGLLDHLANDRAIADGRQRGGRATAGDVLQDRLEFSVQGDEARLVCPDIGHPGLEGCQGGIESLQTAGHVADGEQLQQVERVVEGVERLLLSRGQAGVGTAGVPHAILHAEVGSNRIGPREQLEGTGEEPVNFAALDVETLCDNFEI